MEYVFIVFGLGFMVTLVVAKGVMQAHRFVTEEKMKLETPAPKAEEPK